jgi:hypothetical protein
VEEFAYGYAVEGGGGVRVGLDGNGWSRVCSVLLLESTRRVYENDVQYY